MASLGLVILWCPMWSHVAHKDTRFARPIGPPKFKFNSAVTFRMRKHAAVRFGRQLAHPLPSLPAAFFDHAPQAAGLKARQIKAAGSKLVERGFLVDLHRCRCPLDSDT